MGAGRWRGCADYLGRGQAEDTRGAKGVPALQRSGAAFFPMASSWEEVLTNGADLIGSIVFFFFLHITIKGRF